jgi:hypothetical protein
MRLRQHAGAASNNYHIRDPSSLRDLCDPWQHHNDDRPDAIVSNHCRPNLTCGTDRISNQRDVPNDQAAAAAIREKISADLNEALSPSPVGEFFSCHLCPLPWLAPVRKTSA